MDVRKDFPICRENPELAYLDGAATTHMPQPVIDAVAEFEVQYRSNVHRGTYALAERTSVAFEESRADAAALVGAAPHETIFTGGATSALNMLAYMLEHSLGLTPGDTVATTVMEHHSSFLPFQELARRRGMSFNVLPVTDQGVLDYTKLDSWITDRTKVVVVTLASNVLGTVQNLAPIVARARDTGAVVVVDAAKAVGHVPVDVKKLGCDFLVFSGHKAYAPMGVGVLYGKEEILRDMQPGFFGGGMIREVTREGSTYAESPARFEAGTPPIAGAIGLGAAARYLTGIGVDRIHGHEALLIGRLASRLADIPGVTLYTAPAGMENAGACSFTVNGIHSHDVAEVLAGRGVAVRAGHHCAQPLMRSLGVTAVVRASTCLYSTEEDIGRLVDGVTAAQKLFA